MLIFPDAPAIWRDCNHCSNLAKCEDPFPPSGVCPHPRHILFPYPRPCRATKLHSLYFSHIAQDEELASIFARWQVKHPIDSGDFLAIRKYHLSNANEKQAILSFVYEIAKIPLTTLKTACRQYYKTPPSQIDAAFPKAIFISLTTLDEKALAECEKYGGHWITAFVDATLFSIRGILGEKYLEMEAQNDVEFRINFEREWRVLQHYLGARYNFTVVPRLSYRDMVRYQLLPKGDSNIRRTISTYLVHQCFFYPHFGAGWISELRREALWPLVRRIYTPLIEATIARAAGSLQLANDEVGIAAKIALRDEVESAFDKFASQFDFFLNAPEGFMKRGYLCVNEDKDAQAEIDKILAMFGFSERSTDINATPFAHYIKEKFHYWLEERYPRHKDFITSETNVVTGADGQIYLTIEGAEKRFGVSIDRLRYMDRVGAFKPIRARDVAPTFPLLAPDIRLYMDTPQTREDVEIADGRAKTHSLGLSGKELTRKQAAVYLKISYDTLREMEKKNLLKPRKKGQAVVYDEVLLNQANLLIEQKKAKKNATRK